LEIIPARDPHTRNIFIYLFIQLFYFILFIVFIYLFNVFYLCYVIYLFISFYLFIYLINVVFNYFIYLFILYMAHPKTMKITWNNTSARSPNKERFYLFIHLFYLFIYFI